LLAPRLRGRLIDDRIVRKSLYWGEAALPVSVLPHLLCQRTGCLIGCDQPHSWVQDQSLDEVSCAIRIFRDTLSDAYKFIACFPHRGKWWPATNDLHRPALERLGFGWVCAFPRNAAANRNVGRLWIKIRAEFGWGTLSNVTPVYICAARAPSISCNFRSTEWAPAIKVGSRRFFLATHCSFPTLLNTSFLGNVSIYPYLYIAHLPFKWRGLWFTGVLYMIVKTKSIGTL
jgi:hypothetical protein